MTDRFLSGLDNRGVPEPRTVDHSPKCISRTRAMEIVCVK